MSSDSWASGKKSLTSSLGTVEAGVTGGPPVMAAENALHDALFYSLARLTFREHSGHVNDQ